MFSRGQAIFGVLFAVVFIIAIVFTYIKDSKIHKSNYKNTALWVIGSSIVILTFFGLIRYFMHGWNH
ncbi:MAG: hypothetical protein HRT66_05365 [Flavobacteriaceae bacterium]|nr:hypothetical protein [Flavobacteriaceae bacterium]